MSNNSIFSKSQNELEEVSLSFLEKFPLAPGNIYWKRKGDRFTKLVNAGEPLNTYLLRKIDAIYLESAITLDKFWAYEDILSQLKHSYKIVDLERLRKQFTRELGQSMWLGNQKSSLMDLVLSCHLTFYDFPQSFEDEYMGKSIELYKRSVLTSSLLVAFAFSIGILEFDYLKDLYHTGLVIDSGLDSEHICPELFEALERRRCQPEDFYQQRDHWEQIAMSSLNLDRSCVIKDDELAVFNDENVLELARNSWEEKDGHGANGYILDSQSDLENIICFVHKIIPYREIMFARNDATKWLRKEEVLDVVNIKLLNLFQATFDPQMKKPLERTA